MQRRNMIEIQELDNIDFEPLVLNFHTNKADENFGRNIEQAIKGWELQRSKKCYCHESPLEIMLLESSEKKCKVGVEWACLEECIPDLAKYLYEQELSVTSIQVGEKQVSSSSKSYAYISIFNQSKESLIDSSKLIGHSCYLDYREGESFLFIENLEKFDSNKIISLGKQLSNIFQSKITVWRNLSDSILEVHVFDNGLFIGIVSTSNNKNDRSLFDVLETNFPERMDSMFKLTRPKSKWDLHYGVCSCSNYALESIGVTYGTIQKGQCAFDRRASDYIHFNINKNSE